MRWRRNKLSSYFARKYLAFSLVETVLTTAFVGVGLVGLFLAMQGMSTNAFKADQTVVAINIAQETMERIFAQKDCNEAGCGYAATLTSINTSNTYDESPVTGYTDFVLDTTALEVDSDDDNATDDFLDASPGSGYARITVNVTYNAGADSVNLVALIADYPED